MVNPANNRHGRGMLGCLAPIVLVGMLAYLGLQFGRPWFKNQQFEDVMGSMVGFEGAVTDSAKLARVRGRADSLDLPREATSNLTLRRLRNPDRLVISTEYTVTVTLPFIGDKVLTFKPKAEAEI
jgi:hypothetical protein